jgi:hypothetical protein
MAAQAPPQRLEMPQVGCLGCKSMDIFDAPHITRGPIAPFA